LNAFVGWKEYKKTRSLWIKASAANQIIIVKGKIAIFDS
jgi:hypothetical protein